MNKGKASGGSHRNGAFPACRRGKEDSEKLVGKTVEIEAAGRHDEKAGIVPVERAQVTDESAESDGIDETEESGIGEGSGDLLSGKMKGVFGEIK